MKAKPKNWRGDPVSYTLSQGKSHMSFAMIEARASTVGFEESYIEFESFVDQL